MQHEAKSIKAFFGAKDFDLLSSFYKDLGFEESIMSKDMYYFTICGTLGFYM